MLIVGLFFIWRIYLFIVANYTQLHSLFIPRFPYADAYLIPSGLPQWIWAWANFDGVHYLTIAKYGYVAQFTQAFFPLYPLLISILGHLIKDSYLIISGLFISNTMFVLSLIIFRKLLLLDYKKSEVYWIIFFLILFPTSYYFGALYTESTFFLFVLFSFWFARMKKWWLSGIFGFLAILTRIIGIALLPALIYEYLVDEKIIFIHGNKTSFLFNKIYKLIKFPVLFMIPAGIFVYMIYLKYAFNDPLYFWHAQGVFGAARAGNTIIFPFQTIWRYFKMLVFVPVNTLAYFNVVLEFISFILIFIMLLIGHYKKIRLSYLIFCWFSILIPILTGTFSSMPRYILISFPIYIILGTLRNRFIKIVLLFISFILLTLLTSFFIRGMWIA